MATLAWQMLQLLVGGVFYGIAGLLDGIPGGFCGLARVVLEFLGRFVDLLSSFLGRAFFLTAPHEHYEG